MTVEARHRRDVQTDIYQGDDDGTVREAVSALWDDFCDDEAAWPGGAS